MLQEFYVVVTRKLTSVPFAELRLILSDLALWRIHAPVAAKAAAADRHQRYQVSFWDVMILHSAARLNCITVWSEDLNPGQAYQGVNVMNPFA